MTAESNVVDLLQHGSKLQVARAAHPNAGQFIAGVTLSDVERTAAIVKTLQDRDRIARDLTSGPGRLPADTAEQVLHVMVAALTHPVAKTSLLFQWDTLVDAVDAYSAVIDSDHTGSDLATVTEELDYLLFPLVHGLPTRDACTVCRRTCPSVGSWQTSTGCTNHSGGR